MEMGNKYYFIFILSRLFIYILLLLFRVTLLQGTILLYFFYTMTIKSSNSGSDSELSLSILEWDVWHALDLSLSRSPRMAYCHS